MTKRFTDKNLVLHDFTNEVDVVCPVCSKKTVMTNDKELHRSFIACTSCSYSKTEDHRIIELRVKAYCSNCGEQLTYEKRVHEKQDSVLLRCPACKVTHRFKPKISEYYSLDEVLERYTLWYRENFKGNDLWAYNTDHLEYIEQYIVADLRERNYSTAGTLVARLPGFVKSAKNRDDLLKLIRKMKEK